MIIIKETIMKRNLVFTLPIMGCIEVRFCGSLVYMKIFTSDA